MTKLIAMGGEPATGKTTLIFELIKLADDWANVKPQKLLDAVYSAKLNLYILGKYEKNGTVFQGTDRLSMAVQPDAEKFIVDAVNPDSKMYGSNIIFEGDRLFNGKFLDHILSNIEEANFKILVLDVPHSVKEQRHVDRNDTQDDKFKNSRATKVANICSSLMLMEYIEVMPNENLEHQRDIIDFIGNFFHWSE